MSLFKVEFDHSPFVRSGEKLREIAFVLGGIGTGCVSLDGRGGLQDWEIFGRPNKGCNFDYTFPALWFQEENEPAHCLTLLGPRVKEWMGNPSQNWDFGHGRLFSQLDGIRGFDSVEFAGTFPFARVKFIRDDIPLEVELEAFNPFIPLDVKSSSFPIASMTYRIRNRSTRKVSSTIAWSMRNPIGTTFPKKEGERDGASNSLIDEDGLRGILFRNERIDENSSHCGEFAITTIWPETEVCRRWASEGWWDPLRAFWNDFRSEGHVVDHQIEGATDIVPGTVGCRFELEPGETVEIPFVFSWRFPNSTKYWGKQEALPIEWKTHYGTVWESAVSAASEFFNRKMELTARTAQFENALYGGTQPPEVSESVGATLSVLHSPTLLRLGDGTFWAWEGCSAKEGCCDGTCSHVWNYALSHAYLFPEIQRCFLDTAFKYTFNCGPKGQDGAMNFRVAIPLQNENPLWHAASDGQLGQIVQVYREWRLTGDHDWLRSIFPAVKRALAYAWVQWDRDRDGLVEGDMHNTYDINFCSANPLTQFFYLAALKAVGRMAEYLSEGKVADECFRLAESGSELTREKLWNGDYFVQLGNFTDPTSPRYQHGIGCLSDQLFGQLSASIAGLGDLIESELIDRAVDSIYRFNFRDPLGDHENLQRVYASPDEGGLILCSWPSGETPAYPFVYSDEVWTGIEYQVASHLALLGKMTECETMLRAIRTRYNGVRRNPWNEFECGSHYARALASYGLQLAYTGVKFDAIDQTLKFRDQPFRGFWSTPVACGVAERKADGTLDTRLLSGSLDGISVS